MCTTIRALIGLALAFTVAAAGCGLIRTHIDCDQVAQNQRAGQSKQEIAASMGFSVADVESCSTTPKREASNSDYDQPLLPDIPNLAGGGAYSGSAPSGPMSATGIGLR